ncbi:hypothetical protein U9M48_014009 [Paspalum notatum var. saurae]|uniref:Uncharacterized protein n=1 Tax=Paspalum notatum var. saurae TaxID=547442 RepID=A0AAQ3WKB0_PASNO
MSTVPETSGPKDGKEVPIEEEDDLVSIDLSSSSEQEESQSEAQKEMKKMAKEMAKKALKKMTKKLMAQLEKKMEKKSESTSSPKKSKSSSNKKFTQIPFDYSSLTNAPTSNFTSIPIGKAPILDRLNYADWASDMKMHLISLHPSLWEIVVVGVNIPKKYEMITPEMMQDLHRNAQAVRILNNGLSEEERRKVKGMEIAK